MMGDVASREKVEEVRRLRRPLKWFLYALPSQDTLLLKALHSNAQSFPSILDCMYLRVPLSTGVTSYWDSAN